MLRVRFCPDVLTVKEQSAMSGDDERDRRRPNSGKRVVVGMFVFAVLITGALWFYWYYHTQPFIPLQKAIAAEFPNSAPRVDGGQRRIHRNSPRLLWVVMRVEFDPASDELADRTANRVVELAREHLNLANYDQVNIRLFRGEPEKTIHRRDLEVPLKDPDEP